MLIPVRDLATVWAVEPRGVLHVGAHEAEEADAYAAAGWQPVWWVEMLPDKCAALSAKFRDDPLNRVLQGACWDEDGVALEVFRASNGQSSSLLAPHEHLRDHPDVSFQKTAPILTNRLDSLLPATATFDLVNLDLQGAELRALRGLGRHLAQVKWAYVEVNTRPLYANCCLVDELDRFMASAGFRRVVTRMAGPRSGWGDALYVNASRVGAIPFPTSAARRIGQMKWIALQTLRDRLRALRHLLRDRMKAVIGASVGR